MFDSWILRFLLLTAVWILFLVGIGWRRHEMFQGGTMNYPTTSLPASWSGEELTDVNKGQSPWMRHAIHNSNISDPVIKYKNAYYYEMPNAEYEAALRQIFSVTTMPSCEWTKSQSPAEIMDAAWAGVYEAWMAWFGRTLHDAPELKLSGDQTEIQVVHDRWISAYRLVSDPMLLRMDVEVILYRFGKPHGKHVSMSVIAKRTESDGLFASPKDWEFSVVSMDILGVVPEDQIAIFPVVASNPFDPPEMAYSEDPRSFGNTIIPSGEEVLQEVRRRTALNVATYDTKKKLGETSMG
jgi:hypothetical protein